MSKLCRHYYVAIEGSDRHRKCTNCGEVIILVGKPTAPKPAEQPPVTRAELIEAMAEGLERQGQSTRGEWSDYAEAAYDALKARGVLLP